MMSDVCKHCQNASCLEVCPTNAIVRTEYDSVFIQQDVCNGLPRLHLGLPLRRHRLNEKTGTRPQCTLCYDRLQNGLQPACAKACPTESIKFGYLDDLQAAADKRLAALQTAGYKKAQLYGRDAKVYGGLNAFFLLMDEPRSTSCERPERDAAEPQQPRRVRGRLRHPVVGLVAGVLAFRSQRMNEKTDATAEHFAAPPTGNGGSSPTSSSAASRAARTRSARCSGSSARRTISAPRASPSSRASGAPPVPAVPHRRPGQPQRFIKCCWTRAAAGFRSSRGRRCRSARGLLGFGLFSFVSFLARWRGRMARRRSHRPNPARHGRGGVERHRDGARLFVCG